MNINDQELMERYQITSMQKTVYFYKDYKYDSLDSALKYAESEARKFSKQSLDTLIQQ